MSGSGIGGDFAELDATIAHLQGLAGAPARAVAAAAPKVLAVARKGYAANVGPGGVAWPRNTSNSRYPSLARPAAAVTFRADGSTIRASGEDVLKYHVGAERGGNPVLPARAVFPRDGDMPPEWIAPVEEALRREVEGK